MVNPFAPPPLLLRGSSRCSHFILSATHPLENIEKLILSKLLHGSCERKKHEIMQFLYDIERINPSIDIALPSSIASTGGPFCHPYYRTMFSNISYNYNEKEKSLLSYLFWNNFSKRTAQSLKDDPIQVMTLVTKHICGYCGRKFKKRRRLSYHIERCMKKLQVPTITNVD